MPQDKIHHEKFGDPTTGSISEEAMVFFDLETTGLDIDCDVLQIAMKRSEFGFSKYIIPHQPIESGASEVNGLTYENGELLLHGRPVPAVTKEAALNEALEFLKKFEKPVVLVAHNCPFDAPRLMRIISETMLVPQFKNVISGFADTLPLFRNKFPNKSRALTKLAAEMLGRSSEGAHEAFYDACILEELTERYLDIEQLMADKKNFDEILQSHLNYSKK